LCATDPLQPENLNITCAPQANAAFPEVTLFICPKPTFEKNPDVLAFEVDLEESPANLINLYTHLDLMCKPKKATAFVAMAVFAGSAIGCLFVPRLGDLLGRKPIFCIALAVQAPLLGSITFLKSLKIIYAACFVFGICVIGRMACGFLLMMELVPTKNQAAVGAGLMVAEGSV
jgi:MFS family permease